MKTKRSIRRIIAGIFIAVLAVSVLLCWLAMNFFQKKYDINSRTKVLQKLYRDIDGYLEKGDITSEEFEQELQHMVKKYNMDVLIMNENSEPIVWTVNDAGFLQSQFYDMILMAKDAVIIEKTTQYVIERVVDRKSQMEYLSIVGFFEDGTNFIARTSLESIEENARLSSRLLLYIGFVGTIAGGFIIWLLTKKITKPIEELSDISEKMSELDFEAKYQGKSNTEIGVLGKNINKLSEVLEQTISELKNANNELRRDIAQKEEIDEMRKDFLSNVSHELKTPIALIQGYAEGILDGIEDGDKELREYYCNVIVDETAKMNRMVRQLMTLNQLEFGNAVVTMERFDIVEMIRNYVQSAGVMIQQKEVTVSVQEEKPIYVWGDEFGIEEVVTNYFTNALNHVNIEKRIDIQFRELDERRVRISVFNTGEPIPEESIPHLWEKFYKIDKARTRAYGGSGVGLSIVKAILDAHHQEYGVNNYNNGVEFWFTLDKSDYKEWTDK